MAQNRNGTQHEPDWKMPAVQVGQVVLWNWNRGSKDPSPAIVIGVGNTTVNLAVHASGIKDHTIKSGVRHQDDPFLRTMPSHDGGVWLLTPRDERINAMLVAFEEAESQKTLAGTR